MLRLQSTLPARYRDADENALQEMIAAARLELGDQLLILGHHYQRDEVYRWADATGDSYKLAKYAAEHPSAKYIVFCGVHFMAESADILTSEHQIVVLPDLNAGCSMADMAPIEALEEAWEFFAQVVDIERVMPITYMNSSAAVKAFVGARGGAVCTSSNATKVIEWALKKRDKVFFLPDQHLGRNTARAMGYTEKDECIWDPDDDYAFVEEAKLKEATFILWKGHCSVHQRFTPEMVRRFRSEHPDGKVIVHPEVAHEVVLLADYVGSTEQIKKTITEADSPSVWGVGTEIHLVQRLAREMEPHGKTVMSLDPIICPCSTMFRIDAAHLAWCLESLARGEIVNQVTVDSEVAESAKLALDRMLDIAG
jgi:quinolinate synthase